MNLKFDEAGEGTPLVVAHGLFGSRSNWRPVARELAKSRRVLVVDLRNHGSSPWDDDMSYAAMAADLAAFIDRECQGNASVLGHSMGGKAALHLAITSPERVDRLVLADIAPVAYDGGDGGDHLALIDAMTSVDLTTLTRREQADAALREAGIASMAVRAFLLQNLVRAEEGSEAVYCWRLNLEVLRGQFSSIRGWPEVDADASFPGLSLLVRGGASEYCTEEGIAAARALLPALEVATLAGAGHWLHAEQPEAFLGEISAFLAN